MKTGRLIDIEGPDTAGKSTVIEKLKSALPIIYPRETFVFTREPGNTLNGAYNRSELIREQLLTDSSLTAKEQAKLFAESRYYHTIDIIKLLKEGHNVITDRYLLSSVIYQGLDLGFNEVADVNNEVLKLLKENNIEINNIVLQITPETYKRRMATKEKDAMEDVDERKVLDRIMYYNLVRSLNEEVNINLGNMHTVNANASQEDVIIETLNHIHNIIR